MGELEGRVAIVTGCGRERGIGRACALALAREGAAVVVSDVCREFEPSIRLHGVGTWDQLERLAATSGIDHGRSAVARAVDDHNQRVVETAGPIAGGGVAEMMVDVHDGRATARLTLSFFF